MDTDLVDTERCFVVEGLVVGGFELPVRPGVSGPQVNVTPRVSTSEGTRPVAGPSDMPGPSGRDLAE